MKTILKLRVVQIQAPTKNKSTNAQNRGVKLEKPGVWSVSTQVWGNENNKHKVKKYKNSKNYFTTTSSTNTGTREKKIVPKHRDAV
jgi:hypothetical protein